MRSVTRDLEHDYASPLMQGIILALEALVAAGSQMVGTPQAGRMEVTRHEALRDDVTKEMEDKPAFERYLKGVRKEGAPHTNSHTQTPTSTLPHEQCHGN